MPHVMVETFTSFYFVFVFIRYPGQYCNGPIRHVKCIFEIAIDFRMIYA